MPLRHYRITFCNTQGQSINGVLILSHLWGDSYWPCINSLASITCLLCIELNSCWFDKLLGSLKLCNSVVATKDGWSDTMVVASQPNYIEDLFTRCVLPITEWKVPQWDIRNTNPRCQQRLQHLPPKGVTVFQEARLPNFQLIAFITMRMQHTPTLTQFPPVGLNWIEISSQWIELIECLQINQFNQFKLIRLIVGKSACY